jgi:hypothetical protein
MSIIKKGHFIRKTIGEKQFKVDSFVDEGKKFITEEVYNTNGEYLLVIKNVDTCRVTLDSETTDHIIIKALTGTYIVPKQGLIDDQYGEIFIDKGACVEFYSLENQWFIVSSDGLKLDEN